MSVYIDYKRCAHCKLCYEICPMDVFGWDEEKEVPYLAHDDECQHCGDCYYDCPQKAIDVTYPICLW